MRRLLIVAIIIAAIVTGTSNATLIGVKNYAGVVPDVYYDAGGTITYDASNDLFKLIAWDQTLWLKKPGLGISIGSKIGFGLAIYVDSSGNLTSGVSGHTFTWNKPSGGTASITTDYDMIEYVLEGFSFEWKGATYSFIAGQTFLAAEVKKFGWDFSKKQFDFVFDEVSGKMVDYGLWPTIASSTYPTGAYIDHVGTEVNDWNNDWSRTTEKGDKFPLVPEPGTLILLGTGLLGIAGYGKFYISRRKK